MNENKAKTKAYAGPKREYVGVFGINEWSIYANKLHMQRMWMIVTNQTFLLSCLSTHSVECAFSLYIGLGASGRVQCKLAWSTTNINFHIFDAPNKHSEIHWNGIARLWYWFNYSSVRMPKLRTCTIGEA